MQKLKAKNMHQNEVSEHQNLRFDAGFLTVLKILFFQWFLDGKIFVLTLVYDDFEITVF